MQKLRSVQAAQQITIPALPRHLGRGETGPSPGVIRLDPAPGQGGRTGEGAGFQQRFSSGRARRAVDVTRPRPVICTFCVGFSEAAVGNCGDNCGVFFSFSVFSSV